MSTQPWSTAQPANDRRGRTEKRISRYGCDAGGDAGEDSVMCAVRRCIAQSPKTCNIDYQGEDRRWGCDEAGHDETIRRRITDDLHGQMVSGLVFVLTTRG